MKDMAEERCAAIETNFRRRGFQIAVPKPDAPNATYERWKSEERELFYHPPTGLVSYEAWMTAHGQGQDCTVVDEAERAKIGWEEITVSGYWFTTKIAKVCPLTAAMKLLSLEEYATVYWTHYKLTGRMIDINAVCWLRTRFDQSALLASGSVGRVWVLKSDLNFFPLQYDYEVGRPVEVVANAT